MTMDTQTVSYRKEKNGEHEFEGAVVTFEGEDSIITVPLEKEEVSELRKELENVEEMF